MGTSQVLAEGIEFLSLYHDIVGLYQTRFGLCQNFIEKTPGDRVSEFDLGCQGLAFSFFEKLTPGIPVISEEIPHAWPPKYKKFWLIDPIDGTANMLADLPLFGFMGALIEDGIVTSCAFFLPTERNNDRISHWNTGFYFAKLGSGAWEMGRDFETARQISVSSVDTLSESFLCLEGPSKRMRNSLAVNRLAERVARTRNNLSMAWVITRLAKGKQAPRGIDAVLALGNKPWDNLPGVLLITEAGGRVTDPYGNPLTLENCTDAFYSNGHLHDEALALLGGGQ